MINAVTEEIPLDPSACYAAMRSHDHRFDGRFFCGVSSTKIYCRPVCRVKVPKEENCTFFVSAAAAEAAGFRPCLRCRPEVAPGLAPADSPARLARSAAQMIDEECLADMTLYDLAQSMGITDRHLRRVFLAEYGVTPVQYLQTRRLLLAKNLLTDTSLPVTEVAMSSGFGSIRRFNDLFRKKYRLAPSSFREKEKGPGCDDAITVTLGYRPPYAWDHLLSFLAARAIPGVESVADGAYRRTVALEKEGKTVSGWISVANNPKSHTLLATLSVSLLPALPRVLAKIRHLFDLNCEPTEIFEKLSTMEGISFAMRVPGIRLPGSFDPFEMCTRAILGQQITVKAARTLAARLAFTFGKRVATPFEDLYLSFPTPATILTLPPPLEDRLGPLGIIRARTRSIAALAAALEDRTLTLSPHADARREMEKLAKLPGFGPWTVQYVAMRALGWPDAFPATDFGVKKALSGVSGHDAAQLSQGWSPWRSYATITLWNSLNTGPSKKGEEE